MFRLRSLYKHCAIYCCTRCCETLKPHLCEAGRIHARNAPCLAVCTNLKDDDILHSAGVVGAAAAVLPLVAAGCCLWCCCACRCSSPGGRESYPAGRRVCMHDPPTSSAASSTHPGLGTSFLSERLGTGTRDNSLAVVHTGTSYLGTC